MLYRLGSKIGDELTDSILNSKQKDEADIYEQRQRVSLLKEKLRTINVPEAMQLLDRLQNVAPNRGLPWRWLRASAFPS